MMEIEGRVTNIGPIGATLLPMTVALVGPIGKFADIRLPQIKLLPSGTDIHVPQQHIEITDHKAFHAFVKSIMVDEHTSLTLDNGGHGKIKAMFMTTNVNFCKVVKIKGMNGPKIELMRTSPGADGKGEFFNTFNIKNPSPLEIYIDRGTFLCLDSTSSVVAELYGELDIVRGNANYEMAGTVKMKAKEPQYEIRLIGTDVTQDSWMKQAIKYIDMQVILTPAMTELLS